jgi:flagellar hook-associated protein 2
MSTSSTGTISSTGLGSGLDVKSIVSQLVAIEKQPLTQLQTQATKYQTQLSTYGTIKSQVSTLYDAAALLSGPSGWNAQAATSSNAAAVGVTATNSASATSLTVEVSQLARAQTSASVTVLAGAAVGASGDLKIELGNWSSGSFVPKSGGTVVPVTIAATDTMAAIATKINAAGAGVTATVLSDGTNERLVLKSSTTGTATGFRLDSSALTNPATLGLTNPGDTGFVGQTGLDAKLKINGVDVVSATNKMTNAVPGVTLQLSQVTAGPVDITVAPDLTVVHKNIQSFVDAYNALNTTISDATAYNASTKVGGPLLGDSTTRGIQMTFRSILGSSSTGSTFSYLTDVGIERQTDGSLKINQAKLTSAQADMPNLKALFTADNGNSKTNGFGSKVRDYAHGLITFDGMVTNKTAAVQRSISSNATDQDKVTLRASKVEAQLLSQYSALDTKIASLNGLNSYVTAQLAVWNKSTA